MAVTNLSDRDKIELAGRYDENKRTFERVLARDMRAFFANMGDDLFASLEETGRAIDFDNYAEALIALLIANYRKTGAFFSSHLSRLLKEQTPKSFEHEEAILKVQEERSNMEAALLLFLIPIYRSKAKEHAGYILSTTSKIYRDIEIDVISRAILAQEDLTQDELARRITREFNKRNRSRVKVISENEVGDIAQVAKNEEARRLAEVLASLGLLIEPRKTWITVRDDRVRGAHMGAHRQQRKLDELYLVGGELLEYPHDQSHGASLSNVINCRCDSVTEV